MAQILITLADNAASASHKINLMLAELLGRALTLREHVSLYRSEPIVAAQINRLIELGSGAPPPEPVLRWGSRREIWASINQAFATALGQVTAPATLAVSILVAAILEDF